jgi:hypothetical protein
MPQPIERRLLSLVPLRPLLLLYSMRVLRHVRSPVCCFDSKPQQAPSDYVDIAARLRRSVRLAGFFHLLPSEAELRSYNVELPTDAAPSAPLDRERVEDAVVADDLPPMQPKKAYKRTQKAAPSFVSHVNLHSCGFWAAQFRRCSPFQKESP